MIFDAYAEKIESFQQRLMLNQTLMLWRGLDAKKPNLSNITKVLSTVEP